jgi:hypothetical protein
VNLKPLFLLLCLLVLNKLRKNKCLITAGNLHQIDALSSVRLTLMSLKMLLGLLTSDHVIGLSLLGLLMMHNQQEDTERICMTRMNKLGFHPMDITLVNRMVPEFRQRTIMLRTSLSLVFLLEMKVQQNANGVNLENKLQFLRISEGL